MQKVLIIVGPTASGKSALAVHLARRFHGEVISADSRQMYRGLDIGTGKITKREMKGVPPLLLDAAPPKRAYPSVHLPRISRDDFAMESPCKVDGQRTLAACRRTYKDRKSTRLNSSHMSISY